MKTKFSGSQVGATRELLKISQGELAKSVDLSLTSLSNFETGKAELYRAGLDKIRAERERRGIEFTNGNSPPSTSDGIGGCLNYSKAAEFARAIEGAKL